MLDFLKKIILNAVILAIVMLPGLVAASLLASELPWIVEPAYHVMGTYIGAAFVVHLLTRAPNGKAK